MIPPIINVYNKADLVENTNQYPLTISTKTLDGIENLLDTIVSKIYPNEMELQCLVPYSDLGYLEEFKNKTKVTILEHLDEGQKILISGPKEYVLQLEKYHIN